MAYDRTLPRAASPERAARLRAWAQRKPCVALMGEFSAGKSTLLNFLIEENLIPTRATATEVPPVWFSYGDAEALWVDANGTQHPLDPADLGRVPMTARYVRIYSKAEILEHCDIVDTPGISDPNLAVESWRFAARIANLVLWCSSATQAWRETERSTWTSLPERLRRHSLLVVTRVDKLVTEGDRDKVDRRLARETADLFKDRVFMATPDAVKAKAELLGGETSTLWESSGAADLLDRLAERFEAIYEDRAELLERHLTDAPRPVMPAPMVRPVRASVAAEEAAQEEARAKAEEEAANAEPVTMPTRPVRVQLETPRRVDRLRPEEAGMLIARLRSDTLAPDAADQDADQAEGADDAAQASDDETEAETAFEPETTFEAEEDFDVDKDDTAFRDALGLDRPAVSKQWASADDDELDRLQDEEERALRDALGDDEHGASESTDAETEIESEAETETEFHADVEAETEAEAEAEAESEAEMEAGDEAEAEMEAEAEVEMEADAEVDLEAEPEVEAGAEMEAPANTETGETDEADLEAQAEAEAELAVQLSGETDAAEIRIEGPLLLDAAYAVAADSATMPVSASAVRIWHDIVARTELDPGNRQIAAMIEQLLVALEQGAEAAASEVTQEIAPETVPAAAPEAEAETDEAPLQGSAWRRLA